MAPGDTARRYHALTSYSIDTDWDAPASDPRLVQGFTANDVATFPPPSKAYAEALPGVELPRSWPPGDTPTTAILAGGGVGRSGVLDLEALARLLHLSMGIVREAVRRDGRHYRLRATGSAGGLFPYEAYVAARAVDGVPDGVHWFDPLGHRLLQVGPAPDGRATTLVLTGVPWRTGWRYAERGYRHLYWDVGAILAQQVAVAHQLGVPAEVRTVFPDTVVSRLVGADGVQEFPLALLTLAEGDPAIGPTGDAAQGRIAGTLREFPLVTEAQHAGDGEELGGPLPEGDPLAREVPDSPGLDDVILRRASTRVLDPERPVSRVVFEWCLAAALRGSRVPHYIAVHNVDGPAPGLYRWPELGKPVRAGDLRGELYTVCLEQPLGRDAAFVLIGVVDLDEVDDRGYRAAQLDAGLVSGRMHLAAVALGIAASGMTFLDGEIPSLLGEPLAALLFTCVGVAAYRHRPGGTPGEPKLVSSEALRDRMA
jgi:SagB-type dehydrogenase family enzyme